MGGRLARPSVHRTDAHVLGEQMRTALRRLAVLATVATLSAGLVAGTGAVAAATPTASIQTTRSWTWYDDDDDDDCWEWLWYDVCGHHSGIWFGVHL